MVRLAPVALLVGITAAPAVAHDGRPHVHVAEKALSNDIVVYSVRPKTGPILTAIDSPETDLAVVTNGLISNYRPSPTEQLDRDKGVQAALISARVR